MSDEKGQQEPSMEDILASIRRILSEDEAEEKPAPEPEPPPPPRAAPPPMPAPEPEPDFGLGDDFASMFDPEPPKPAIPMPVMAEPEEDVLELTDDMVHGEIEQMFDDPEPFIEPDPPARPMLHVEPDIEDDFAPPPRVFREEALVSPPVDAQSTSALAELARTVARERGLMVGNGNISLEGLVREMLRPILKDWLDANLPNLIERIVKTEIERMVNRAERL